jgi:Tfp pilus assembly PilM family ATPase
MLRTYGIEHRVRPQVDLAQTETTGVLDATAVASTVFEICQHCLEQLIKEVKRSLEHFSHQRGGFTVENIVLLGTLVPHKIDEYFADALSIPTSTGKDVERLASLAQVGPDDVNAFALAASLVL